MTTSAREVLIGELLGDVGQLIQRIEAAGDELRAVASEVTQATAQLDQARDLTVRSIVAAAELAQRQWGAIRVSRATAPPVSGPDMAGPFRGSTAPLGRQPPARPPAVWIVMAFSAGLLSGIAAVSWWFCVAMPWSS